MERVLGIKGIQVYLLGFFACVSDSVACSPIPYTKLAYFVLRVRKSDKQEIAIPALQLVSYIPR